MSFAITLACLVAAGLALLRLLRLATGDRATDVALAWLVGSGAFAAAAPVVRFALGIPLSRATVLSLVLVPVLAWAATAWRRRAASAEGERASLPATGRGQGEGDPAFPPVQEGTDAASAPRWLPRPVWLFAPLVVYVAVVAAAALLHGANTPTYTDDGVRVRAFAPMLAFADGWAADARAIFVMAGALPTFVPALGWIATGALDHFHVNYFVGTELVALLVLAVAVPSSRGDPERGWASAFALLSIPLFVFHVTSTYSDAVLAMRVAGGVMFAVEYARGRDRADAWRALLLLGLAALVKREGELVAAAPAAVLLAQLAWERRRGIAPGWQPLAFLAAPVALGVAGKVAAVGLSNAFPMLGFVAQQSVAAVSSGAGPAPGRAAEAARIFFGAALFRSGNAGMLYWVLAAAIALRARAIVRSGMGWPLAAVLALFTEAAVSSIALVPQYTLDQSTVHRALLVVSVPAALWLAAVLADAARDRGMAIAAPERVRDVAEAPTPPARRRSRRASRR